MKMSCSTNVKIEPMNMWTMYEAYGETSTIFFSVTFMFFLFPFISPSKILNFRLCNLTWEFISLAHCFVEFCCWFRYYDVNTLNLSIFIFFSSFLVLPLPYHPLTSSFVFRISISVFPLELFFSLAFSLVVCFALLAVLLLALSLFSFSHIHHSNWPIRVLLVLRVPSNTIHQQLNVTSVVYWWNKMEKHVENGRCFVIITSVEEMIPLWPQPFSFSLVVVLLSICSLVSLYSASEAKNTWKKITQIPNSCQNQTQYRIIVCSIQLNRQHRRHRLRLGTNWSWRSIKKST